MASEREIQLLIGIAMMSDDSFRAELVKDPISTAKNTAEIQLTPGQAEHIAGLSVKDLNRLAVRFQSVANPPAFEWGG